MRLSAVTLTKPSAADGRGRGGGGATPSFVAVSPAAPPCPPHQAHTSPATGMGRGATPPVFQPDSAPDRPPGAAAAPDRRPRTASPRGRMPVQRPWRGSHSSCHAGVTREAGSGETKNGRGRPVGRRAPSYSRPCVTGTAHALVRDGPYWLPWLTLRAQRLWASRGGADGHRLHRPRVAALDVGERIATSRHHRLFGARPLTRAGPRLPMLAAGGEHGARARPSHRHRHQR